MCGEKFLDERSGGNNIYCAGVIKKRGRKEAWLQCRMDQNSRVWHITRSSQVCPMEK